MMGYIRYALGKSFEPLQKLKSPFHGDVKRAVFVRLLFIMLKQILLPIVLLTKYHINPALGIIRFPREF